MKTYQDLLACGNDEKRRMKFVLEAIDEHKASARYQMALTADKYRHQKNETIEKYQKLLRTMMGTYPMNSCSWAFFPLLSRRPPSVAGTHSISSTSYSSMVVSTST